MFPIPLLNTRLSCKKTLLCFFIADKFVFEIITHRSTYKEYISPFCQNICCGLLKFLAGKNCRPRSVALVLSTKSHGMYLETTMLVIVWTMVL